MPTDITDVDAFTAPVVAPASGDARTAASVVQGLQPLANRTRAAINALIGHMLWSGGAYTASGAGLDVFVQPPRNLVLPSGTTAIRLSPTDVDQEVPTAVLTADAWAYIYGYNNASAFGLLASLDAPDPALVWRGDGSVLTHRYLCTIKRDSGSGILPFERRGGQTRWTNVASTRVVLSAASALTATNVDCSDWAPPHARMVTLLATVRDVGAGGGSASLARNGGSVLAAIPVAASGSTSVEITVPCDELQLIDYLVSGADIQLTLTVLGWLE